MGLVLTYNEKVRQALKAPVNFGIDAILILSIAGLIAAVAVIFGHAAAPRAHAVTIDLRFRALPLYTFYSLSRGVIAYLLSLVFTLVYGTISSHNRTAERFMVPALDVLQSLPMLTFLPGLVTIFARLFPNSWLGLELACVVTIFTAQAWNMTFSYHASVRSIPTALQEAAQIQRLNGWQRFRFLELPASMIGLVWNSMMSMAGGWFVITVNEAFTLNGQDYRLPGLGSYMKQAQDEWNVKAMIAGVIAVIVMIVFVDQVCWRPIVVWSQRFKLEDVSSSEKASSWVLTFFRRSRLLKLLDRFLKRRRLRGQEANPLAPSAAGGADPSPKAEATAQHSGLSARSILAVVKWLIVVGLALMAMWGVLRLSQLLIQLPIRNTPESLGWISVLLALFYSFLRTSAAVVIGALWTLPAGVLIGLSPKWSNRLQPIVQIVASFPAPMIYPVTIFLLVLARIPFGTGCVALMLLGTQWYTLFNVIAGAMAIPSDLREAGRVYHLSRWKCWTQIYIPAVFPYLLTGLITAAGGAWNATIIAEEIPIGDKTYKAFGLGSIIDDATAGGNYALLAAAAVIMGLTVVLINRLFWKRFYRIAEARYSLNV
ncbi:MAG: ABC transporter permease subunit [Planctomycetota bacterium]|nr:ABC transporter permease subunit [Planctomycetota bacterium]